mgnify:CR=1 FL=1
MKVTSIDNRGTAEEPSGFVWFDDREAVAFRAGPDAWHVEHGNPNWPGSATDAHLKAALAYLKAYGVEAADVAAA